LGARASGRSGFAGFASVLAVLAAELQLGAAETRFYEKGSDVVPLKTKADFRKHVSNSSFLWVLQLYRES